MVMGNEMIEGIVIGYGVPGRNGSNERLLPLIFAKMNMCEKLELVVKNSWFRNTAEHKNIWLRTMKGKVCDRSLMDFLLLSKNYAWKFV